MDQYAKFSELYPLFYERVKDFPDFILEHGLSEKEIAELERKLEFGLDAGLRKFFAVALKMNGLAIKARELGSIVTPASDALIIGEFFLYNDGDRLLMLPDDPAVYYLEQRNGAITRLAGNLQDFFNLTLPKFL